MQHVVAAQSSARIAPALSLIDPVALTMLAVNRLAPATLRTVTEGRALTILVPDAQVAEIFRAALAEMQKARRTDRLIDIVVSHEPAASSIGRMSSDGTRVASPSELEAVG